MSSGNKKDDKLVAKEFNHGLLVGYLIAQRFPGDRAEVATGQAKE